MSGTHGGLLGGGGASKRGGGGRPDDLPCSNLNLKDKEHQTKGSRATEESIKERS